MVIIIKIIGWYFIAFGGICSIAGLLNLLFPGNQELPGIFNIIAFFIIVLPYLIINHIFFRGTDSIMVPYQLPYLFHSVNDKNLFYQLKEQGNIILFCWSLMIILCGTGILRRNNFARIAVILLSIIYIAVLSLSLYLHPLLPRTTLFENNLPTPMDLNEYLLSLIFPVLYIIFFICPKVKEQFKEKREKEKKKEK